MTSLLPAPCSLLPAPCSLLPALQGYDFKNYPESRENGGTKQPTGKGICLITEAKIIKKPLRCAYSRRIKFATGRTCRKQLK
ncbi:MAG: hypothetical protein F6K63_33985 [Moorea sp. SIO1G6]|nr:hypothetical protein [Moorena sp. SIO1G6]